MNTLHYTSRGEGFPFLFQHGLGANLSQVTGLLENFPGVRLITADMRGHGLSQWDAARLPSFDSYVDDLIALLDELEVGSVIMGGISMGAGLTLNMASRFPERVDAMILVRPAWLMEGTPENLGGLLDISSVLSDSDGKERFQRNPEFVQIMKTVPNAAQSMLGMFDRDQQEYTAELLNAMVRDVPVDRVPDKPALVLGNDDDPLHPWEMAEAWHKMLPSSEIYKIPSRYIDPQSHARELNQHIQKFINQQMKLHNAK